MLVLPGVKQQSGMLCPGGVNRSRIRLSPREASLSVPGQSLVNALAIDQRRRKLCVPVHRVNVPKGTATENGTTTVTRLLPNAENEE